MLAKISLASVRLVKPGPQPPPLPPKGKTQNAGTASRPGRIQVKQETAVETARLNNMLDDTLDLASISD